MMWTSEELGDLNHLLMELEEEYDLIPIDIDKYERSLEGTHDFYHELVEYDTPAKYIQAVLIYHMLLYNSMVFILS